MRQKPSGSGLSVLAGIQYWGEPGSTQECLDAVLRLIQCRTGISNARVLSNDGKHGVLVTVRPGDLVAVRSGFTSGYRGEGPRGFSQALAVLQGHGIEVEEFDVDRDVMDRLNHSALTTRDLERLDQSHPVRPPRWSDYLDERNWRNAARIWQDADAIIPLSIIDERLFDLAVSFWEAPDAHLLTGYRRLEDAVRERADIEGHGHGLFSEAFLSKNPKLSWSDCSEAECKGRAHLFIGAYMAYRNPRAHKATDAHGGDERRLLDEFLLLNHLFVLEREATDTPDALQGG